MLYLVEPTAANIEIISNDLKNGLYSPAYVNFIQSIPRPLLEDFAARIASMELSDSISQVYDQYLNFIVSEPNLFSLGMGQGVYAAMNSNSISDEDLDAKIDRIVSGLFSVAVTMGRFRRGNQVHAHAKLKQAQSQSSGVPRAVLPKWLPQS